MKILKFIIFPFCFCHTAKSFLINQLLSNFIKSFYSSVSEQCSSLDLVFYGDFSTFTTSQSVDPLVPEQFSQFRILQIFQLNRSKPLSRFLKHFGCLTYFSQVENMSTFSLTPVATFGDYFYSSYYFFLLPINPLQDSTVGLTELAELTKSIKRPAFLALTINSLRAFITEGLSDKTTIRVFESEIFPEDINPKIVKRIQEFSYFNKPRINLRQEELKSLVCAVCMPKEDVVEHPIPIFNTLFTFMGFINATLIMEPIFSDMNDGNNFRDGEWDEWVEPLLDGTAATSMPLKLVPGHLQIFYPTKGFFLRVTFHTGRPRKAGFNSLRQLADPFKISVWILTVVFVLTTFIVLELIPYVKSKNEFQFPGIKIR
ncbi:unnamed protein product, partial [Allacma fusca]